MNQVRNLRPSEPGYILNGSIPVDIKLDDPKFIPEYKTPGSAAADVRANIPEMVVLLPGERAMIDLGFSLAIPEGWEIQVRCRSGFGAKGIQVTNGIGTIDSDYRQNLKVLLNNITKEPFVINPGDRVAQIALKPVWRCDFKVVDALNETERQGGFGSTGVQ